MGGQSASHCRRHQRAITTKPSRAPNALHHYVRMTMNRSFLLVLLVSTAVSACGGEERATRGFEEAVDQGASCSELFEIRNELDSKSPLVEEYNETLRSIRCYSSSSKRRDTSSE
jgi:hypothetical protein